MAHKKGQGSTRNGRDSNPQYRGVKRHDGQVVTAGNILVKFSGKEEVCDFLLHSLKGFFKLAQR